MWPSVHLFFHSSKKDELTYTVVIVWGSEGKVIPVSWGIHLDGGLQETQTQGE